MMFKRANMIDGKRRFSVGILLENGELKVIESDTPTDHTSWKVANKYCRIPGEVFCASRDPVQFKANLFLTLKDENDHGEKLPDKKLDQDEMNAGALGLRARSDIQSEIKAYVFSNNLCDIT